MKTTLFLVMVMAICVVAMFALFADIALALLWGFTQSLMIRADANVGTLILSLILFGVSVWGLYVYLWLYTQTVENKKKLEAGLKRLMDDQIFN
jgi:ABC-type transport system involved in cytochrome c biogenesis permease subunit